MYCQYTTWMYNLYVQLDLVINFSNTNLEVETLNHTFHHWNDHSILSGCRDIARGDYE